MIAFLSMSSMMGCVVGGGEEEWAFDAADVERVEIWHSAGEVEIAPGEGEATVSWSGGGLSTKALPTVELAEGLLRVDASCGVACGGELLLVVPEDVALALTVERGEALVELPGSSAISACVSAGELELVVDRGGWALDLDVAAGELDVEGVFDDEQAQRRLQACVGAGELSVLGD
jgi:hypothetical protein